VTQVNGSWGGTSAYYSYDQNGNLTNDTRRGLTLQVYGRENLPWNLIVNHTDIAYSYDAGDSRFWKEESNTAPDNLKGEWYLKAGGKDIAVLDYKTDQMQWFIFGDKRIAKIGEQIPKIKEFDPNEPLPTFESVLIDEITGEPIPSEDGLPSQSWLEDREKLLYPNLSYYLYDHLGNTRVVFNVEIVACSSTNYTIETAMDYFPYGKALREYQSGVEKYMTTHHERDAESGLDYRGARFYDAEVGRFLSLDPLAVKYSSLSAYCYVGGNPINYYDPDGKRIRGVSRDRKTGQLVFNKQAGWDGTKKYVEARMKTAGGQEAINKLMNDKKTYTTLVTDKVLVIPSLDGKQSNITQALTDPITSTLVISTSKVTSVDNLTKEQINGAQKLDNYGQLVNANVGKKDLADPLKDGGKSEHEKKYQKAKDDSGISQMDKDKPFQSDEEMIHGVGAHEEVHLMQKPNYTPTPQDVYDSEKPAFDTEKKAREDYINENPK
jgi:RHS repeat-associated protein